MHQNRVGYYLLCWFTGTLIFLIFMLVADFNNDSRAQLDTMVNGSAYRPFVYRQLVPFTARLLSILTPDSVESGIEKGLNQNHYSNRLLMLYHIPIDYYYETLIIVTIMYLSLLGVIAGLNMFIRSQFQSPPIFSDLTPLIVTLGLVPTFTVGKIYDLTAILVFLLGLLCMVKHKWYGYFALFILGCFNKETTLVLIIIFATHFYLTEELPRRVFVRYLALQSIIWAMTRVILMYVFRNNLGEPAEMHLIDHVNEYNRIAGLHPVTCIVISIIFFLVIPFIILHRWNQYPRFLLHANIGWPVMVILYLLIGNPFEFRVFQESLTLILILGVYHYMTWRGIPIQAYDRTPPTETGVT